MQYTVAICTWNRADILANSIASVAAQVASPAFEILVVDNASTDRTPAVVERLASSIPGLRRIAEPRLGLSHARNRALEDANGDIVVFLDDDAVVDKRWLAGFDEVFSERQNAGCAGGPVRLQWPRPAPAWLPSFAAVYYGELDLGMDLRRLGPHERPRGLNLAVRRDAALSVGGFKTDLGRRGTSLASGEEDEFLARLSAGGYEVWWAPRASVSHVVDPNRMTPWWLLRRAWMQGRSETVGETAVDARGQRWGWADRVLFLVQAVARRSTRRDPRG